MNVYFSANARDIESQIESYRLIVRTVQESGSMIINNWTEAAAYRRHMNLEKLKWQEIHREVQSGIDGASVVIAEVSGQSVFGVGYEVCLALSRNKPVLALVQRECLQQSYACDIVHPLLTIGVYEDGGLDKVVKSFIESMTK